MIRIVSIVEVVDDNCELIVEVGDNRCWPCKSNRGNPPLDTTDQPPSDIISAIETMIKIKAKTKIMTKQGCIFFPKIEFFINHYLEH